MYSRILRAILAILFVTAIASASFFVSTKLSTNLSVSPNAPESKAQAAKAGIIDEEGIKFVQESAGGTGYQGATAQKADPTPKPEKNNDLEDEEISFVQKATPTIKKTPTPSIKAPTPIISQSPSPTPEPTPAPNSFGAKATAEQKASGPAYLKDENNNCSDGLGFVSGTGCFNGQRRVLNIPETQKAYLEHVNQVSTKLSNQSNEEILKEAGIICDPNKTTCQKAIADAQAKVLANNLILGAAEKEAISKSREQLQALKDITNPDLSANFLINTYGSAKPEVVLNRLGLGEKEVAAALKERDKILIQKAAIEKINEYATMYLSLATDSQLATEFCNIPNLSEKKECLSNFERKDLLAGINPNSVEYKSIVVDQANQAKAQNYADPNVKTIDLALAYCNGQSIRSECVVRFTREQYLNTITEDSYKITAQVNRQAYLSSLIPQVVGATNPTVSLDLKTKNEVIKLNEDTQHAYWAFLKEKQLAGKYKTAADAEKIALEFNALIAADPKALVNYINKYQSNTKIYTDYAAAFTFKPSQEMNSLINASIIDITKKQTITGLTQSGQILPWKNVSEEYKKLTREKACEENKTLEDICNLALNPPNATGRAGISSSQVKAYQEALAELNTVLSQPSASKYLQAVFDEKAGIANLPSVIHSNIASIDNPTVSQEIRKTAVTAAVQVLNPGQISGRGGRGPVPTSAIVRVMANPESEIAKLTNQNIERQLVVETYTRGTGIAGSLASAAIATALCAELGPGAIACGAVGGLAGVISNFIPILGTATAEEIEAERQAIADKVGNDTAATFIQALYSNQGALSDEGIGRSQTTRDNRFAGYNAIQTTIQNSGATLEQISSDPTLQSQIALQPYLLDQWEALQNENETQAYINLAVAPIVGGVSGGVGSSIVKQAASGLGSSFTTNLARNVAVDTSMWLGGAVINDFQTQYQFDQTVGFVDTQSEIALEACIRQNGASNCQSESQTVATENQQARNDARLQAAITDAVIQAGQTSFSVTAEINNYVRNQANIRTSQTSGANDSTFISPQLAREINNIDPRILANTDPNIISAAYAALDSSNRTGLSSDDSSNLSIVNDIKPISENYIVKQLVNQRSEGPLSPLDQNIINTIRESNLRKPEGVENLAADIVRRNTLTEPELEQSLISRGYTKKEVDIAKAIKTNSDPLVDFINDPTMPNYLALDDHVQVEAAKLNISESKYLEIASRYNELLTGKNIPEETAGFIALLNKQNSTPPTDPSQKFVSQLESISGIPSEKINGLTSKQQSDLDSLVTAVNNSKTISEKIAFTEVLKQTANNYLNDNQIPQSNNLIVPTGNANTLTNITFESATGIPTRKLKNLPPEQKVQIDNLILAMNNAETESQRLIFQGVLLEQVDSFQKPKVLPKVLETIKDFLLTPFKPRADGSSRLERGSLQIAIDQGDGSLTPRITEVVDNNVDPSPDNSLLFVGDKVQDLSIPLRTEQKNEILKGWGITQSDSELKLSPSSDSVSKLVEIGATAQELIDAGYYLAVRDYLDLMLEINVILLEKGSPQTYSEMIAFPFREDSYNFLRNELGLTPEQIITQYGLHQMVMAFDPLEFLDLLNLEDYTFEAFQKVFPGKEYEKVWIDTILSFGKDYEVSLEFVYEGLKQYGTPDNVIFDNYPEYLPEDVHSRIIEARGISPTKPEDTKVNFFLKIADDIGYYTNQKVTSIVNDMFPIDFMVDYTEVFIIEPLKTKTTPISNPIREFIIKIKPAKTVVDNFDTNTVQEVEVITGGDSQDGLGERQIKIQRLNEEYEIDVDRLEAEEFNQQVKEFMAWITGKKVVPQESDLLLDSGTLTTDLNFDQKTDALYLNLLPFKELIISAIVGLLDRYKDNIWEIIRDQEDPNNIAPWYTIDVDKLTPTQAVSPTLTPTPTETPVSGYNIDWKKENNVDFISEDLVPPTNKYNFPNTYGATRQIFMTLSSCQDFYINETLTGENMSNCFCSQVTNNCQEIGSREFILAEKIKEVYNSGGFNSKNTFELLDIAININFFDNPNYCSNSKTKICDKENKEVYIACPVGTATTNGFVHGDIIVSGNRKAVCMQPVTHRNQTTQYTFSCTTIEANNDTGLLEVNEIDNQVDEIDYILRSKDDLGNEGCWTQ